jgi:predicted enzyme related to lactoylglutathione lyase
MGRVVHFEVHADDLDRAERFYVGVFGWSVQRWEGPVDYRLLRTGDAVPGIDGALVERRGAVAENASPNGFVCTVEVDDLAATSERIVTGGGQQVVEPQRIPEVGTVAYFKDTEGNIFGVLEPVAA